MPVVLNATLCGFVGAIAANTAYVRSNMFILGDVIRRGRHPLWDPVAFGLMGFVGGIAVGIVASRLFAASPLKATLVGLGATLLGIAVVGGASTMSRYRELYSHANMEGPSLMLEFELRLPANHDPAGELPKIVGLDEGAKISAKFPISREAMRVSEGRIIMPGVVPLKKAWPDRILSFPDEDVNWYAIFTLLLNETPIEREFEWTDWQEERNPRNELPVAQRFQLRYRVKRGSGG